MNKVSFVFRNQIVDIDFDKEKFSPNTTLLQFLRSKNDAKGTKEGCNEGDCGACTVVLVEKQADKLKFRAVNSCVMFLPAVHGKQVITIEDLGSYEELHPIQQIFVDEHASQCGFCTPGFIMSLFAQKADKINSSTDELVEAMHGNLCRCTGYRPIVAAAEDIAKVQDLQQFETFAKPDLIDKIANDQTVEIHKDGLDYFIPKTFEQALILKEKHKNAVITSGSTDLVLKVTKRKEKIAKIIDISSIDELQGISETNEAYIFGAGTKIEDIYQFSKQKLPAFAEILSRFGAKQIRNRATIGGNVATASPIGDVTPILFALSAKIITKSSENQRTININNFITGYRQTDLKENELIYQIVIPKLTENQIVHSYKISKRKHLDISTVSAGFSIHLINNKVSDIILAYGGMAAMTKRATKTEEFLKNKEWTYDTISQATKILYNEFEPITDARASAEARRIMAKNLLIKFFNQTQQK